MAEKAAAEVELTNHEGLHARPSSLLVQTASGFQSDVSVCIDGRVANAKSIMEVMMLASPRGTHVRIHAEGPDAAEAVRTLVQLFESGFGEP